MCAESWKYMTMWFRYEVRRNYQATTTMFSNFHVESCDQRPWGLDCAKRQRRCACVPPISLKSRAVRPVVSRARAHTAGWRVHGHVCAISEPQIPSLSPVFLLRSSLAPSLHRRQFGARRLRVGCPTWLSGDGSTPSIWAVADNDGPPRWIIIQNRSPKFRS